MFQGTVESFEGGVYIVLYDELVQGKPCRERNIDKSRIKAITKRTDKPSTQSIIDKVLKVFILSIL